LLRHEARELFRRGSRSEQAQRRNLSRLGLNRIKAAVGVLGIEHGEHTPDPIARQAEFRRFCFVIILIRRNANRQHLAHRYIRKLVMQPCCDPFSLRDAGDSPAGQFIQPVPAGGSVLGREGLGAEHAAILQDIREDLRLRRKTV
jgi:hypothetical protein